MPRSDSTPNIGHNSPLRVTNTRTTTGDIHASIRGLGHGIDRRGGPRATRLSIEDAHLVAFPQIVDRGAHSIGVADRENLLLIRPGLVADDNGPLHLVDLLEDGSRLVGGHIAPGLAHEEPDAERGFQMLHRPADAWLRDIEEAGGAGYRTGNHDGAHDFDLPERQHLASPGECRLTIT